MEKILHSIYYNPKNKASFSSVQKLYAEAVKRDSRISLGDVKKWLSSQINYTLHKPVRRNWKRNRVIVHGINEEIQCDLVDMQEFKDINKGYGFILTAIDVLSKYAWAFPLSTKSGDDVAPALQKIFNERQIEKIRTDHGTDFSNNAVKDMCELYEVYHAKSQNSKFKCSVVERFNRTLKTKMYKYFTHIGKNKYIDVLQHLVKSYNASKHRSIKMAPKDVNFGNQHIALRNLYGNIPIRSLLNGAPKTDLKAGDTVRIQYEHEVFDKSYLPNWSDQIFYIKRIVKSLPRPMYILENYIKEEQPRRFYREELQKVTESSYRIEKIISERKRRGVIEVYVKWLGYPDKFNSWIPKRNVTNIDD
jgi:Integrase core domain/Chromo (CHRromatin Organisation MOdifier) domain